MEKVLEDGVATRFKRGYCTTDSDMDQQFRQQFRRRSHSTPAIPGALLARTNSENEARGSNKLLSAIEFGSVDEVRSVLAKVRSQDKSVLAAPSLVAEHGQRTPFMAAVARGDLSIFTALLHYFDRLFSDDGSTKCRKVSDADHCPQEERDGEMRSQLMMHDTAGMTLAMLAARGDNVSIFSAVMAEIKHTKAVGALEATDFENMSLLLHAARCGRAPIFRIVLETAESTLQAINGGVGPHLTRQSGNGMTILMHAARSGNAMALRVVAQAVRRVCHPHDVRHLLYETDADGMNFLMHSVVCSPCQPPPGRVSVARHDPLGVSSSSGNAMLDSLQGAPQLKRASSAGESSLGLGDEVVHKPDPAVPVFNVSVELVKKCLWKGQVRDHFTATDLFGRTVLTHAVRSKHCQLFEAALRAIRQDVLDPEVEEMLDTSSDDLDTTPLRSALVEGGKEMQRAFEKARHRLKKQVSSRAKLSTIEAKIQSFIPGKLIVIFQLLLPITEDQDRLYLLLVMCFLAPIFNWASSLLLREKPVSENPATLPRKSAMSFLLGAPALFAWGIGTSDIGLTFGWGASRSAAALAVATVVIPATDGFFNSKSVEFWYEQWSCQKKRFVNQAKREFRRRNKKPHKKGHDAGHTLRHSAAPEQEMGHVPPSRRMAVHPLTPPKESAKEEV